MLALELGCGTGLAGLYCAGLEGVVGHVYLSDYCPTVERLAQANITRNALQDRASFVHLDWGWVKDGTPLPWARGSMDLILACDEEEDGGRCLPRVVEALLAPGGVFLLVVPLRPNYRQELGLFDAGMMRNLGQVGIVQEGEECVVSDASDAVGGDLDHRISIYRRQLA